MYIKISVPGKIILSGEHAVVYGKPAIAAAIDKRLTVVFKERNDGKEIIHSKIKDTSLIRKAIGIARNNKLMTSDTRDHGCLLSNKRKSSGWELKVKSDIPVGAGMGSSAAVAVGVISTFITAQTGESKLNHKRINNLAYKAEKLQHGEPSGIDNSTVTFGGLLWYRKELEFIKFFQNLPIIISKSMNNFWIINTGKPEETTKDMVAFASSKLKTQNLLNNFEGVTKKFMLALKEKNEKDLINNIRQNKRLLEKIGVVGKFAKKIVREVEKSGGAAKISGAGGIEDKSGILLIYHKDESIVKKIAEKYKLDWFPAKLGVEGARIEGFKK